MGVCLDIIECKDWNRIILSLRPVIRKAIYKHIYSVDVDTVKEVEQQIFIKIYEKHSLFKNGNSIHDWAYIVAVNHVHDILRKKRRSKMISLDSSIQLSVTNPFHKKASIIQLLNLLPEEYRFLLIKKYIFGFKQKEIAEELNLPIGTIGGKIQAGVKLMQLLMKKEGLIKSDF